MSHWYSLHDSTARRLTELAGVRDWGNGLTPQHSWQQPAADMSPHLHLAVFRLVPAAAWQICRAFDIKLASRILATKAGPCLRNFLKSTRISPVSTGDARTGSSWLPRGRLTCHFRAMFTDRWLRSWYSCPEAAPGVSQVRHRPRRSGRSS